MGDVIPMPPRPRIAERYTALKTYGQFGAMSVALARIVTTEEAPLALVLDGLPKGVGFEVLARFNDTPNGNVLADQFAHAVTMALMHTVSEGDA